MKNQKRNYLSIGILIIVGFIIFGFGGNYLKKQNQSLPLLSTTKVTPESFKLSGIKTATVLVKEGSSYGPPFDPNLYQLEISKGNNLFAKSDLVDLKKYLGKNVEVKYREVIGVIMGEQQLVTVDSIK